MIRTYFLIKSIVKYPVSSNTTENQNILITKEKPEEKNNGIFGTKALIRQLYRSNQALKTVNVCAPVIHKANEENSMLREICQKIVIIGQYRMCIAGYFNDTGKVKIKPVALAGLEEAFLNKEEFAYWVEKNLLNPDRQCLSFLLGEEDTPIGYLGIFAGEIDSFDKEETYILSELAISISEKILDLRKNHSKSEM